MRMRKFAALVAAAGLAFTAAACGSDSTDGASTDEQVELLVWDTGLLGRPAEEGGQSFLDIAVERFQAEFPNITVKVVQQGGDISTNGAQFQAAAVAGTGPDIRIQYAGGPTLSFAEFFADHSDVFDADTFSNMSGWNTVRENYDPNGKLLGMPYGAGLYFNIFYNKQMLQDAGLNPDDHPETWDELLANARQIKERTGKNAFWMANLEGYVGAWFVGAMLGGELGETASLDMYRGTQALDSEAMLKVYQAWADLGASGLTNPDAGSVSNGESTAGFVQGKGAYYLVGSWENSNMATEFGDGVGTFYIPMLSGAQFPKAVAGGPAVSISITNYSTKQEAAKEFLRFLARPDIQDIYVQINQSEASNHKQSDPSVIQNALLQEQARQLVDFGPVVFPFDSVMPQSVIDLFYRLNASVFLGQTSPADAVAQLQAANEQELASR